MPGEIGVQDGEFRVKATSLRHLGVNVIILLLGWTWGFYLDRYEMLQEGGGGSVFGAGYTDINVVLPALWVMIVATLVLAGLVAYNLYQKNLRLLGYGVLGPPRGPRGRACAGAHARDADHGAAQ